MISDQKLREKCSTFVNKLDNFRRDPQNYQPLINSRLIPITEIFASEHNNIDCKEGCDYCCNYRVEAYSHEIVAIFQYLNSHLSEEELTNINKKISHNQQVISQLTREEHLKTNVPCMFLVNSNCSIYPVRPTACASCYSPDRNFCEELYNNPDSDRQPPPPIKKISVGCQIEKFVARQSLSGLNEDSKRHELSGALKLLFSNPQLAREWLENKSSIFPPE